MDYVILDLEWNGTYSSKRKGFLNEIIEFGAIKLDQELKLVDRFHQIVRPQVGKRLNGKVRELTRISHEELAVGNPFLHVAKRFSQWAGKDTTLLTWGTGDLLALLDNYKYYTKKVQIPFLNRYLDLQSYVQNRLGLPSDKQLGLLPAAELLGISTEEAEHHRALEDCELAYLCLQKTYRGFGLSEEAQLADKEFFRKLTFKTTVLSDLNNPLVDHSQMFFDCDRCGRRASRASGWELRNRVFRARFQCDYCNRPFYGKVQFRLKYEGPVVWKKIAEIEGQTAQAEAASEDSAAGG